MTVPTFGLIATAMFARVIVSTATTTAVRRFHDEVSDTAGIAVAATTKA